MSETPFIRGPVAVRLVRDESGLAQVKLVRAVAYMAGQSTPAGEEFDGNDFCASHILATVEGEPAGTIRLRWFAGFAKVERITVVPRFEGPQYAVVRAMAEYGLPIIRAKGYTRIVTHAQARLVAMWRRVFPFLKPVPGSEFVMYDHVCVVMAGEVPPEPAAIGEASPPLVQNRPEGLWHLPGPADRSAERPATAPDGRRRG